MTNEVSSFEFQVSSSTLQPAVLPNSKLRLGPPKIMSTARDQALVVFMTAANGEEAGQLAEMLVSKRLAACVQILPEMESVYRWQGKIGRQREVLLIAKTVSSKFAEFEREVVVLHSYETPEIVAFPLTAGSRPYLEWLSASVAEEDQRDA